MSSNGFINIYVNENQIKAYSKNGKSVLVKLPKIDERVWIGRSRFGLYVNKNWSYGDYSGSDIAELFGVDVEDYEESYLKVEKPRKLDINNEIDGFAE